MAKSEAKRQKKLAKRRTKDLKRQRETAREKNRMGSFAGQFQAASNGDVLYCGMSDDFETASIGSVVVVRRIDASRALMVRILIDSALLGIKDVATETIPLGSMGAAREMFQEPGPGSAPPVPVAEVKKFILGAIEFSARYGFKPDASYQAVATFLDDVDVGDGKTTFQYGINGEPTYFPGPFDSPQDVMEMTATLEQREDIRIDMQAVAASVAGLDDFAALDDPELDVDIDEDVQIEANP